MAPYIGSSDRDTEVLVIGAGLIGAVIAAKLAENGLAVAVVDAQSVGGGATRRALGLVMPSLHPAHRRDTARGVELLASLARQHNLKPRPVNTLHVASQPADADALRGLADELRADGLDAHWEMDPSIVPGTFGGGLSVADSIQVDLALLTMRLLQRSGVVVKQNLEIQSLERSAGGLVALAPGYSIRASSIVLATNAYTGLLSPYLGDAVTVARGAIWRSRPQARALPCLEAPVVVDGGRVVALQTADMRLHVAAWYWDGRPDGDPAQEAHSYLDAHMPDLLTETEAWLSSTTIASRDGGPLVGVLSGGQQSASGNGAANSVTDGVYYALAGGPFGPAWAPIIAEQVASLALQPHPA